MELDCRGRLKMSVEGKGDDSGRTRTPPPVDEGPLEPVNGVVYPPTNPPAARYLDTYLDLMYTDSRGIFFRS